MTVRHKEVESVNAHVVSVKGDRGEAGILSVATNFTIPATTTPVACSFQYSNSTSTQVLEGGYDITVRCSNGYQIDGYYNNGTFTRKFAGVSELVAAGAHGFVVGGFDPKRSGEVVVSRPTLSAFIAENLYRLPDNAGLDLQGFNIVGDISMPSYYWDDDSTATPDNISVVKPTHITGPGRAIMKHNGVVHADWFGGKTSQAVQKAINSIERGTIYLSPGEWTWTTTVRVKKNIQILGSGNATLIKINNLPNLILFDNDSTLDESCTGVSFRNFEVWDNGPPRLRTEFHFVLANTLNIFFEAIYFTADQITKDSKSGIFLWQSTPLTQAYGSFIARIHRCIFNVGQLDIRITDCYVTETAVWGNHLNFAIHVCAPSIMISNCMITGPSLGPNRAGGIWIEDTVNFQKLNGINIEGCYFDGSYDVIDPVIGIYVGGSGWADSRVVNNWIWRQDKAILINGDSYAIIIADNSFQNNGRRTNTAEPDIYISPNANFRYSSIHDNTFTRQHNVTQSGPALAIKADPGTGFSDEMNFIHHNIILPNARYAADAISCPGSYILSDNLDGSRRGANSFKFTAREIPTNAQNGGFFSQVNGAVNSVVNALIGGLFVSAANGIGFAAIQGFVNTYSDSVGWNFYTLVANVKQLALKLHTDGVVEMPGGITKLGSRYLWFDSTGDLRTGATRPTSLDTEGTVVGSQS